MSPSCTTNRTKNTITLTRVVVRVAVVKEMFSSPLAGRWSLSDSTRGQSDYFGISKIGLGHAQPGREVKNWAVMTR